MDGTLKPLFIHIPKTGGASVCKTIGIRPVGHRRLLDLPDFTTKTHHVFGFLRCPLDRAVSIYYFLKQQPDRFFKNRPANEKGMLLVHRFINDFNLGVNEFWQNIDPVTFPQVVYARRQKFWLKGPLAEVFNAYDFGDYTNEVDRLCNKLSIEPKVLGKKIHATKRRTAAEELDVKTVARLRKLYAVDFQLLEKYKFKHG